MRAPERHAGQGQACPPWGLSMGFGKQARNDLKVSYHRARYYDPSTGRFLSEDPSRFGATTDFYSYTGNNPTNFTDPTGLARCGNGKCPPPLLQLLAFSGIMANEALREAYSIASPVANATGNTVVVGLSGNVGANLIPEWFLGGSAGGSVGLGVDPCGNVGLVVSGQLGGGYRFGTPVSGGAGGSFTYTHSPTLFGLNGSSPVVGVTGGYGYGGSVTQSISGSTTVTVGPAAGASTIGGVKWTKVIPLVCSTNCQSN